MPMFLAVVLFLGVTCSAFPTSEDGVQCLARCSFESSIRNVSEDATDSLTVAKNTQGHSVFKRDVVSSSKSDDMCEPLPAFLECMKSCPPSRLDAVVQQITQLVQKECSTTVSQEERESKNAADCLLGSALDELKADYPADVDTFVADSMKLMLTFALKDPKSPPEACSILYEPYKA